MNMYPPTLALVPATAPLATNHPLSPPVGSTLLSAPAVSRCLLVNIHRLAVTNIWEIPGCFSMGLVTVDLILNRAIGVSSSRNHPLQRQVMALWQVTMSKYVFVKLDELLDPKFLQYSKYAELEKYIDPNFP